MAKNRYTEIVVLCEDKQTEVFARTFLKSLNIGKNIRVRIYVPGKGSKEQFVRKQLAAEVQTYRSKSTHISIALVIITDADDITVENRRKLLDTELRKAGLDAIRTDERIAIFIPKRNIETWIHYLDNQPVNEEDKYQHFRGEEAKCKPLVEKLAENCRQRINLPDDAPPSLKAACEELKRLYKRV